jgi:tryptophanyl-tRNA synthetase
VSSKTPFQKKKKRVHFFSVFFFWRRYDEKRRPELAALLRLYASVAELSVEALPRFGSKAALKRALTELLVETLAPLRARAAQLEDAQVRAVLREGAERAALLAEPVLQRAKLASGLKD